MRMSDTIDPDELTLSETIWAMSRENMSSGFPTERHSNQSNQLEKLATN